jgi:hypothetical protein
LSTPLENTLENNLEDILEGTMEGTLEDTLEDISIDHLWSTPLKITAGGYSYYGYSEDT